MQKESFVESYDQVHRPRPFTGHESQSIPQLDEAWDWSNRFGDLLFDYCNDQVTSPSTAVDTFNDYSSWYQTEFAKALTPLPLLDDKQRGAILQQVHFHSLHNRMISFWTPLVGGSWKIGGERLRFINMAQDSIALHGISRFLDRAKYIDAASDYLYFSEEKEPIRKMFEGTLNECDSAIVLLEIMKRNPDLTVIPAPPQFKQSNRRPKPNADFIAVHKSGQMIGIQVKSSLTREKTDEYDRSRILFIDTSTDMANSIALRTAQRNSHIKRVSWGGIICAQRYIDLSKHQQFRKRKSPQEMKMLLVQQQKARSIIDQFKPHLGESTQIVGKRILSALGVSS